jgi:Uri superfamily endonuclease
MEAVLLQPRCVGAAITGHRVCCETSSTAQGSRVKLFGSLSCPAQSNLCASFRVPDLQQCNSGKGRRGAVSVRATLATDEEGANKAKPTTEEEGVNDSRP